MDPLDAYLDACLEGRAEEPEAFLARHADLDEEARGLVRAMFRAAPARRASGLPFERIGEFRLVRALGEGGMGSVYLARQESLDRDVALKLIRPELRTSATVGERFRREGAAVGRLRHPHIVAVHAMGEHEGVPFIAMEYVPGRNLDEVLAEASGRGEPLPLDRVLEWTARVADALAHAHGAGVVHRDVKPSNIRVTPEGRPLLLYFGLARAVDVDGSLTASFTGSPLYAAPEQLTGAPLDARADVYGLGVTLYQCLTGRVPFPGRTFEDTLRRVLTDDPVPPRRIDPSLSRDLETVVLKAIARDPDAR